MYGVFIIQIAEMEEERYYEDKKAIAMEYVEGKTLRQILKEEGKLDSITAINYALQIIEGLSFLHSQGISHRDLKPENIIITEDGVVKLIDFGLATSSEIAEQLWMNRMYAAPEFKIGEEYKNSDLWSFGLILYEMLTGEHLIKPSEKDVYDNMEKSKEYVARKEQLWAETQTEIDEKYKQKVEEEIDGGLLKHIIYNCLKVNPEERYKSSEDIYRDLLFAKFLISSSNELDDSMDTFNDVWLELMDLNKKEKVNQVINYISIDEFENIFEIIMDASQLLSKLDGNISEEDFTVFKSLLHSYVHYMTPKEIRYSSNGK